MRPETAKHFNDLGRELRQDPKALERRMEADLLRIFGMSSAIPNVIPNTPKPMRDNPCV